MPTWSSSASASSAIAPRARPPESPGLAVMREQRHLHVLAHRHRGEGRGDLEGAADAQAPDRARRQPGDVASRRASTLPASGRSWPLSMLKQVVLPAPLGPISASSSPASTREAHAVDGLARRRRTCRRPSTCKDRLMSRLLGLRLRRCRSRSRQLDALPTRPCGNSQHQQRRSQAPSTSRQYSVMRARASPAARQRRRRRRSARSPSARRRAAPSAARRPMCGMAM